MHISRVEIRELHLSGINIELVAGKRPVQYIPAQIINCHSDNICNAMAAICKAVIPE